MLFKKNLSKIFAQNIDVGALTFKRTAFVVREWDYDVTENIDMTDSYGLRSKVYVTKNKIATVEPETYTDYSGSWISDKSRHFLDEVLNSQELEDNFSIQKNIWLKIINDLIRYVYSCDLLEKSTIVDFFFTTVFENLNTEILNILLFFEQRYSFVKLRKSTSLQTFESNLEYKSQVNLTNRLHLTFSTLCILFSINTRYEGYYLNLSLRQRFLKGNFKIFILGSLVNFSYSIAKFLGANLSTVNNLTGGNHFICRDIYSEVNPIILCNDELLKKKNNRNFLEHIRNTYSLAKIGKTWRNFDMLNSSIHSNGEKILYTFLPTSAKDFTNFSSLYFLNLTEKDIFNFKKITELKLLNYSLKLNKAIKEAKVLLDQNSIFKNNIKALPYIKKLKHYYLPTSSLYANDNSYVSAEGSIKRIPKGIPVTKAKNSWQIVKNIMTRFKKNILFLTNKDNFNIFYSVNNELRFNVYTNFQFYAIKNLTVLSFYLSEKNNPLLFNKKRFFKMNTIKVFLTKLKYWLDDFYTGSQDLYTQNSPILADSSEFFKKTCGLTTQLYF